MRAVQTVQFPVFRQLNTLVLTEIAVVCLVLAILGPFLGRVWPPLRFSFVIALIAGVGPVLYREVQNKVAYRRWLSTFKRHLNQEQAVQCLKRMPGKYVLHIKFYRRLDRTPARPIVLLEECGVGFTPVKSKNVAILLQMAKELGVPVRHHG